MIVGDTVISSTASAPNPLAFFHFFPRDISIIIFTLQKILLTKPVSSLATRQFHFYQQNIVLPLNYLIYKPIIITEGFTLRISPRIKFFFINYKIETCFSLSVFHRRKYNQPGRLEESISCNNYRSGVGLNYFCRLTRILFSVRVSR